MIPVSIIIDLTYILLAIRRSVYDNHSEEHGF